MATHNNEPISVSVPVIYVSKDSSVFSAIGNLDNETPDNTPTILEVQLRIFVKVQTIFYTQIFFD